MRDRRREPLAPRTGTPGIPAPVPGPASFWCACVDSVPQVSVANSRGPAGYGNCPDVTRGVLAAQEDAVDYKLSVFRLFAELFPEFTNSGLGLFVESLCVCAIATGAED